MLDIGAWAIVLTYADAVRAHRSPYWPGGSWEGWGGAAVAGLGYGLLIAIGALLLFAVPGRGRVAFLRDAATPLAALAAWGALAALGGDPGWTSAMGLFLLAAPYAVLGHLIRDKAPAHRVWLPALVGVVFCGGMVSLAMGDYLFFLSDARATAVTAFSTLHVAFMLAVLAVAVPLAFRAAPLLIAVLAVVMALAPTPMLLAEPARPAPPDSVPPNVVLITFDALRTDWISAYGGHVPMPAFDRLSAEGIRFEHAYTLGPWTIPSMFGCMASRVPESLPPGLSTEEMGRAMSRYRFEPGDATLPERLAEAGIFSAAYGGNTLLNRPEGILRGYALHSVWPHRPPVLYGWFEQAPLWQRAWWVLGLPGVEERPVDTTRILRDRARAFITRNAPRPYFLWVHFMDPHGAFSPPPRFRPEGLPWAVYCNADPHWGTPLTDAEGRLAISDAERSAVQVLYEGEMRYVDQALGAVLDALEASGVGGRTMVIVTSDHGEEFWDHGEFGHGQSLHDELVRAPFLVRGPGIPAEAVIEQPLSQLDLVPTIAGVYGIDPDEGWLGVDRFPYWREGLPGPEGPVFAQGTNLYSRHGPLQMMIDDGIKFIRSLEGDWQTAYRLEAGSGIEAPLSPAERRRREQVLDGLPVREGGVASAMDAAIEEQLRAFGYIHE